ncbi:hypothetical protein [Prochlorococcus marinus]|uniref:hypothetical protein n=1 Tax=Prochlorococcus marinus TaxID=1219 RepID=UPI001650B267|nr:hypothetical protein [Prochlorococcus marinus]
MSTLLANHHHHSNQYLIKMTSLQKKRLKLTESELLTIKDRIKHWNTKDKVIDMMRYRYGRLDNQAA